jgi:AraC family transcriptional regulator of arabinose operon
VNAVFTGPEVGQVVQQLPIPEAMEVVKVYLREHVADPVQVTGLARLVALSPFYFIRMFKAHVGVTPHRYLTQARIERARELLRTSSLSVTQICHRVGFSSLSHFVTTFRKHTGMTPLEYRRSAGAQEPATAAQDHATRHLRAGA